MEVIVTMNPRNVSDLSTKLGYFLEVAESANITRAANRLDIGQPALSKAIRSLEKELEIRLFVRTRLGVVLTPAGKRLHHRIKRWFEDWREIHHEVSRDELKVMGEFSVGCHAAVGAESLPQFLPELLTRYPEIRLRVINKNSRETLEDVLQFKTDFGLVIDPFPYADLAIVPLKATTTGLWESTHRNALNTAGSPESVLLFNPEMVAAGLFMKRIAASVRITRVVPIDDYEVIAAIAASGGGIAALPDQVARRYLSRLRPSALKVPVQRHRLCLIYRPDFQRGPAVRAIVAVIKKAVQER